VEPSGVVNQPATARVAASSLGTRPFVGEDQSTECGFPGAGTRKSPSAGFRGSGWAVPLGGRVRREGVSPPRVRAGSRGHSLASGCRAMSPCSRRDFDCGRCSTRGLGCEHRGGCRFNTCYAD